MKILEKIKNAIFEEEEFDEEFTNDEVPKRKIKAEYQDDDEELKRRLRRRALEERMRAEEEEKQKEAEDDLTGELVKQIDVEKTTSKREDEVDLLKEKIINEEPKKFPKRESRRSPIIFDDEDFTESVTKIKKPQPKQEEEIVKSKTLYGGYRDERQKEKFKPSPNISPVYGLVDVSPILNKNNNSIPKENHVYVPEKQEEVSLDEVRHKAFGNEPYFEEEDDLGLLYDMSEKEKPEVAKVTLGDAEEYYDDLGLEYNVDYTDKKTKKKTTRSIKNEKLSNDIEKEISNSNEKLEITKEQLKPRTADEIKKIKKIENSDIEDEPEEKNLYDLIDMMYDSE